MSVCCGVLGRVLCVYAAVWWVGYCVSDGGRVGYHVCMLWCGQVGYHVCVVLWSGRVGYHVCMLWCGWVG